MENQKDETNNNQEKQRPIAGMTVFDSRAHFAFVHKKTEKLVAAIYVVSNFIKDNEPLKWSIREKSLELLELATMLNSFHWKSVAEYFVIISRSLRKSFRFPA